MSMRYSAYTVIGQKVDKKDNVKHTKDRGCKHYAATGKFCTECGMPTWIEEENEIIDPGENYDGINIITPGYENRSEFFVCGHVCEVYGDGANSFVRFDFTPRDFESAQSAVRKFLEPRGLWKESQFGIWTLIRVS